MADPTLTNSASGTSTSASVTATFGFTATANRLLVAAIAADDYLSGGTPSGYTAGGNYEGFHGHYVWWKIASGSETSIAYTIGSGVGSAWTVMEFGSVETTSSLDTSNSAGDNTGSSSSGAYSSASVTPSTGRRTIIASLAGSSNGTSTFTGIGTWTSSFVEAKESYHNTGSTYDLVGNAFLSVDGNGSTGFTTSAVFTTSVDPGGNLNSHSSVVLVFKVASSSQSNAPRAMNHFRLRR
jgi:hypothetical protein